MSRWDAFGCGVLVGAALILALVVLRPSAPSFRCYEDEAMVWVDAPHTATCLPLATFASSVSTASATAR